MYLCMQCMQYYEEYNIKCPHCGYERGQSPEIEYHLYPETILNGKYIVGKVLGYGGFGITYKAWDANLEKIVAIKEYYPSECVNRIPGNPLVNIHNISAKNDFLEGRKRFLEEARTIVKFNSYPNIVHVYDYFEENNTAYIVMEYLEGKDYKAFLNTFAQNGQRVPIEIVLKVTYAIMEALKTIHKAKIIHRDLKPGNFFICDNGNIKLIDFGAARLSSGDVDKTRTVIYTDGYAPVEQYQKKSKQGEYTDIYSLGAVLYYSLTGSKPPDALDRVKDDNVKSPMEINPECPQNVSDAVMRAIALKHEYRFQSVKDFEKALKGEHEFRTVVKEIKYKKTRKIVISAFLILLIAVITLITVNLYNEAKTKMVLDPAELTIWVPVTEDDDVAMYEEMFEEYKTKNTNISIEIVGIDVDEYEQKLIEALVSKTAPDLICSTNLNADYNKYFASVDEVLDLIDTSEFWFLDQYSEYYLEGKRMPLTFVTSVTYENILVDDNSYADTLNEFLLGENTFFKGTIEDYTDVQRKLAGKYSIKQSLAEDTECWFTNEWSINALSTEAEHAAAVRLLYYMIAEKSMDIFTVQNNNGLSINKEIFNIYVDVNKDFEYLGEIVDDIVPSTISNK